MNRPEGSEGRNEQRSDIRKWLDRKFFSCRSWRAGLLPEYRSTRTHYAPWGSDFRRSMYRLASAIAAYAHDISFFSPRYRTSLNPRAVSSRERANPPMARTLARVRLIRFQCLYSGLCWCPRRGTGSELPPRQTSGGRTRSSRHRRRTARSPRHVPDPGADSRPPVPHPWPRSCARFRACRSPLVCATQDRGCGSAYPPNSALR
jgi:hypothetical protein